MKIAKYLSAFFVFSSCFLVASQSRAHEFWLEQNFSEPASVDIKIGERFIGKAQAFSPNFAKRYGVRHGKEELLITANAGQLPALQAAEQPIGTLPLVFYYESEGLVHQYASQASLFRFLKNHGLTKKFQDLNLRVDPGKREVEVYRRYAKAILGAQGGAIQNLGFDFELVAEPRTCKETHVSVQVLYANRPLVGVQVDYYLKTPDGDISQHRQVSGEKGEVTLHSIGNGQILVNAVHLIPPHNSDAIFAGADWELLWTSLVLEAEGRDC